MTKTARAALRPEPSPAGSPTAVCAGTAVLVDSRPILPGRWRQTWQVAAGAAAGARAGQYVRVGHGEADALMQLACPIAGVDRIRGLVAIEVEAAAPGPAWLAAARPGDTVDMSGPLGRPFEVHPRARHLLLIGTGHGLAPLLALADAAVAGERRVALLVGADGAASVYPSALLPPEVEYVVATDDASLGHGGPITDLVPGYEAWADQAFAAGPAAWLAGVAAIAAGRTSRLGVARLGRRRGDRLPAAGRGTAATRRRAWLQVALEPTTTCATATCLGCVVTGLDGPLRSCRDGPVFAAGEIAWGGPSDEGVRGR